ncbi:MAG: hypothetical protein ACLRQX_08635 [Turicibacter sanguinis]
MKWLEETFWTSRGTNMTLSTVVERNHDIDATEIDGEKVMMILNEVNILCSMGRKCDLGFDCRTYFSTGDS